MAYIPDNIIDEIRDTINIVDLIGSYLPLKKNGSNYSASCPFHEDRNPSFSVSESKQIYKCFSCGRGGNIYSFLQDIEGINFPESVIKAAEFSNYKLPQEYLMDTNNQQKELTYLFDIHQKVNDFYHYYLVDTEKGNESLQYLLKRQISNDAINRFELGLSPNKSEILVQYLLKEGYTVEQLLESGIFYRDHQNQIIDRFHERIIIPLRNNQGRVIAFSGRLLKKEAGLPKYLNSPETKLFTKGSFLFNLDKAKLPIRQKKNILITEGYMDVISLSSHGFENVIATMGTSLTHEHLKQIKRLSRQLIFIFDGDRAGQEASMKAFEATISDKELDLRGVLIPNQMDPDEWIQTKGSDSFANLLNYPLNYYEYSKQFYLSQYNLQDEGEKAKYIETLILIIGNIQSNIERELRVQEIVKEFNLSEEIIKEQIARNQTKQSKNKIDSKNNRKTTQKNFQAELLEQDNIVESLAAHESEKLILYYLMNYEQAWKYIESLTLSPSFYHDNANRAFDILQKYYYDGRQLPLSKHLDTIDDNNIKEYLTSIVWFVQDVHYSNEAMNDCFNRIQIEFIQLKILELRKKIQGYSQVQDHVRLKETLNEIIKLQRQIK